MSGPKMKIPVLKDHIQSAEAIIGVVTFDHGGLIVELRDGYEFHYLQMKEVFGNCGYTILEGDELRIKKFKIIEFSLGR